MFDDSKYCYKFVTTLLSFEKGRHDCERDGGDLATFHNEEQEEYFLRGKYNDFRFGYKKFKLEDGNV